MKPAALLEEPRSVDEIKERYKFSHQRIIAAGVTYEKRARVKLSARREFHVCPQPVDNLETRGIATASLWNGAHPETCIPQRVPTFGAIIAAVAEVANVPIRDMLGPWRHRRTTEARQVAMYLMRHLKNASYPQIGQRLGGRDHATAMHGCRKVEIQMERFAPLIAAAKMKLGIW